MLGTNRIAKAVYAGPNTSLVRLELAASEWPATIINEHGDEVPAPPVRPPATEVDGEEAVLVGDSLPYETDIKPILEEALARNRTLQALTPRTALKLLPVARVLLNARARRTSTQEVTQQIESLNVHAARKTGATVANRRSKFMVAPYAHSGRRPPSAYSASPLLRLPPELVASILREYSALEPISLPPDPAEADAFDPLRSRPAVLASALSKSQFMRVLAIAQDRRSLTQPVKPISGPAHKGRKVQSVYLKDSPTFLQVVGCSRYDR